MKRELDHLAAFMHMAVDYAKKIGFTGQFLHRAEAEGADQAPVRLRRGRLHQLPAGLRPDGPFQAEHRDQPRHAGRPHDDARAGIRRHAGMLGSIDANTGDLLLGWDTDQFPTDCLPDDAVHADAF